MAKVKQALNGLAVGAVMMYQDDGAQVAREYLGSSTLALGLLLNKK